MIQDKVDAVFQQKFASPGSQLDCIIYLSVSQYHPHARLKCKIKGKEKTGLRISREIREGNHTRTIYENYDDKKTIFKYEHTFIEGPIAPGHYQFPYSFTLPEGIPSSFVEIRGPHDYAKIKYETRVKFESQTGGKMKDEDDIYVIQVYPSDFRIQEYKKKQDIGGCCCCCCIDRGHVDLKASFNKTVYHPGEVAEFIMEAKADDSKVSVKNVAGRCMRYVTVKCKGHTRVWQTIADQVNGGQLKKGHDTGVIRMTPCIKVNQHEMSSYGSLIQSEYKLQAVCEMQRCCQTDPQVAIPILVCNMPTFMQTAYVKPYVPPPQYNPQLMPPVIYNLNGPNCINNAGSYPNYYQNGILPPTAMAQPFGGDGQMGNMTMPNMPGMPMMNNMMGNGNIEMTPVMTGMNQPMGQPTGPINPYMELQQYQNNAPPRPSCNYNRETFSEDSDDDDRL